MKTPNSSVPNQRVPETGLFVPTTATVVANGVGLLVLRSGLVTGDAAMFSHVFLSSLTVMTMVLAATLIVGAKPWSVRPLVAGIVLLGVASFGQSVLIAPTATPIVATWGWSLLHIVAIMAGAASWRTLGLRLGLESAFDPTAGPWQFSFRTFAGIVIVTSLYGTIAANLLQSGVLLRALDVSMPGIPPEVPIVAIFQALVLVIVLSLALRGPRAAWGFVIAGAFLAVVSLVALPPSAAGLGPLSLSLWFLSVGLLVAPWLRTGVRTRWDRPPFESPSTAARSAEFGAPPSH